MFTRITFKIKRLDPKTIHNFTKPFLGETGVMKCHQSRVFGSSPGYHWTFSRKNPKRKDLSFLGERSGARLLFEEKISAEGSKSAASHNFMHYQRFLYKNPLLQGLAQPRWPKKGVLWSYLCTFLTIFLYTEKQKKIQIPRPKATILLIYAYMSAQMIIRLNLKTTEF